MPHEHTARRPAATRGRLATAVQWLPGAHPGAAARALAAAAFEDPHAPPVGWYPLPQRATVDTCKSCGQRIVWTKTDLGRAMPLSLALVRLYGDRKHAASHFSDCQHSRQWSTAKRGGPPPRQPTTTNRPAGRIARPVAFEDGEG